MSSQKLEFDLTSIVLGHVHVHFPEATRREAEPCGEGWCQGGPRDIPSLG